LKEEEDEAEDNHDINVTRRKGRSSDVLCCLSLSLSLSLSPRALVFYSQKAKFKNNSTKIKCFFKDFQ
jgi:hypothetical protein